MTHDWALHRRPLHSPRRRLPQPATSAAPKSGKPSTGTTFSGPWARWASTSMSTRSASTCKSTARSVRDVLPRTAPGVGWVAAPRGTVRGGRRCGRRPRPHPAPSPPLPLRREQSVKGGSDRRRRGEVMSMPQAPVAYRAVRAAAAGRSHKVEAHASQTPPRAPSLAPCSPTGTAHRRVRSVARLGKPGPRTRASALPSPLPPPPPLPPPRPPAQRRQRPALARRGSDGREEGRWGPATIVRVAETQASTHRALGPWGLSGHYAGAHSFPPLAGAPLWWRAAQSRGPADSPLPLPARHASGLRRQAHPPQPRRRLAKCAGRLHHRP